MGSETMKSIAHLLVQGDARYEKHQIVWIHEEVSYSILSDNSMFSLNDSKPSSPMP